MDKEMPLFLTNKKMFIIVEEEESVRTAKYEIHYFHYELSKDAPKEYKESYEKHCKERGDKPIYF